MTLIYMKPEIPEECGICGDFVRRAQPWPYSESGGPDSVALMTPTDDECFGLVDEHTLYMLVADACPTDTFFVMGVDVEGPDIVYTPTTSYQIRLNHEESYFSTPHPEWMLDPDSIDLFFIVDGVEYESNVSTPGFNTPGDDATWVDTIWYLSTTNAPFPPFSGIFYIQAVEGQTGESLPGYVTMYDLPADIHNFGIKVVGGGVDSSIKYEINRLSPGPLGLEIILTEISGPLFGQHSNSSVYRCE